MKKTFKTLAIQRIAAMRSIAIIAVVAVMAFSMVSCETMGGFLSETFGEMGRELTQGMSLVGTWRSDTNDQVWIFNSDSTFRFRGNDYVYMWAISGDKVTVSLPDEAKTLAFIVTYRIEGNKLTMQGAGGMMTSDTILTFTRL